MEVGLGPGHIIVYEDPVPRQKGAQQLSPHFQAMSFRPMSVVTKRSPISATAELLFLLFLRRRTSTVASSVRP